MEEAKRNILRPLPLELAPPTPRSPGRRYDPVTSNSWGSPAEAPVGHLTGHPAKEDAFTNVNIHLSSLFPSFTSVWHKNNLYMAKLIPTRRKTPTNQSIEPMSELLCTVS